MINDFYFMKQFLHYTMIRSSLSDWYFKHCTVHFVSFYIETVIRCCNMRCNNVKQHFPRRGRLCVRNPKHTSHTHQLFIYCITCIHKGTNTAGRQPEQADGRRNFSTTDTWSEKKNAAKTINLLIHSHDRTQTLSLVTS